MIFFRKINEIPEFYMTFARKMPEFYIIIARKIFSRILEGMCPLPPLPASYAYKSVFAVTSADGRARDAVT